jgi:enoyl-CoA hydratase/carnithine racemase
MDRVHRLCLHITPSAVGSSVVENEGPAVRYEVNNNIAEITLNRPENRNSMTEEVLAAFAKAVDAVKNDHSVRCVIIAGSGNTFCAGADFKNKIKKADVEQSPWERSMEKVYGPFLSLLEIKVPVIGAMTGHAVGGGLGLALVCDMRVANSQSKYGANFVRLGLHPGMACTYILPHLVGLPKANELMLTGRLIKGDEAAALGLANYSCDGAAAVLAKARELASEVAAAAPLAVRWTKNSIYYQLQYDVRRAAQVEAHMQSRTRETADFKEGTSALLARRDPVFEGK